MGIGINKEFGFGQTTLRSAINLRFDLPVLRFQINHFDFAHAGCTHSGRKYRQAVAGKSDWIC